MNSQQTRPEIPHLCSLLLRNLPVGLFGDKESGVRGQRFPGVVEGLLSRMFFAKSLNPVRHMLEESYIYCMEHIWLMQIRRRNSQESVKHIVHPLDTMSFIRVVSVSSVVGLGM